MPEEGSQASPLQEEVCAVLDAQSAQQFADAPLAQAESGSAQAEWLPVASVPDDCWAASVPDGYSAASPPDDCSVASAWADSVAVPDDSVEPELPQQAARSEQVDLLADSQADSRVLPVDRAWRQLARWLPDVLRSASPVSPQAPPSQPAVQPPTPRDAASVPRFSLMVVRDAPPMPAAVWQKAQAVEAASF